MKTAKEVVQYIGISGRYFGQRYLIRSIELVYENEDNLQLITKRVYSVIAKQYETTVGSVQKDLQTVISAYWNGPGRKRFNDLIGLELEKRPNPRTFIELIVNNLKRENEKDSET